MGSIQINDRLSENTVEILKKNGVILESLEEMKISDDSLNKIVKSYENENYLLTDEIKDFLRFFSNKKILFNASHGKDDIHFKYKKVLELGDKRGWEETYDLKGIIPLGLLSDNHMIFFCDSREYTYASFDGLLLFLGHSPFEGINNLLAKKILKRIEIDITDYSIDINKLFQVAFEKTGSQENLISRYIDEEFQIEKEFFLDDNRNGVTFDIAGQTQFFLDQDYIIQKINTSLMESHFEVVKKLPDYQINDNKSYHNIKIKKEGVDDFISFNFKDRQFLTDKNKKNFMILFEDRDKYEGKRLSKNTCAFYTEKNELIGIMITRD